MLSIKAKKIAVMIGSGLLAAIPGGFLAQEAFGAQQLQSNISQGIDTEALAQVYIIDNEAIPTGDLTREPQAYVSPSDDAISLTVVNTSNSVVSYLFPNSAFRQLRPGERVSFSNWELPNQIGIQQFDGGLTGVDRIVVSESGESATVYLDSAPSFGASVTGLSFFENGAVYTAS